jgi:hypothetical protein
MPSASHLLDVNGGDSKQGSSEHVSIRLSEAISTPTPLTTDLPIVIKLQIDGE